MNFFQFVAASFIGFFTVMVRAIHEPELRPTAIYILGQWVSLAIGAIIGAQGGVFTLIVFLIVFHVLGIAAMNYFNGGGPPELPPSVFK